MSSELLMAGSKPEAKTTEELSKAETIILPKDKTNRFVYFFKQNIRVFYLILLHIIMITIFGYIGFHTEGYLVSFLGIFLMILGFFLLFYYVPFFYYISSAEYRLSCLSYNCKMKLLVEVITHKPNVNTLTWRPIAYNLNQYAFDQGICPNKSFFYDGNSCYQVFHELAILPCGSGNSNKNSADADQKTGSNSVTTNTNGNYSSSNFELQSYIAKALVVYKESVDKYWADEFPEATI